jgi:uncharacterized protein (TIGR00730 family)
MTTFQNLTVYLGSSGRARPVFQDSALELGRKIGEQGKHLIYGGMDAGLMGLVANAALEAGAEVTGIVPKNLQDSERIHPTLSETILVGDLWERKAKMFSAADVIVALPGGYGTLDESLEVLYWGSLKLHNRILALVNIEGYWDAMIAHIRSLPDFDEDYLVVAGTIDDMFAKLNDWTMPPAFQNIENAAKFPHFEGEILIDTDVPIIFNKPSIAGSYHLVTALGLKQLNKHSRAIGLLNDQGQFDNFLSWVNTAMQEHFITDHCRGLFCVAHDLPTLHEMLERHVHTVIDLNAEKWGDSVTDKHLEIKETD